MRESACAAPVRSLSMFNIDDKSNEEKIAGRHIDVVYSPRRLQRLSPDPFTFSSLIFIFIFLASFNQSSGWVGGRRGSGLRAVLCCADPCCTSELNSPHTDSHPRLSSHNLSRTRINACPSRWFYSAECEEGDAVGRR